MQMSLATIDAQEQKSSESEDMNMHSDSLLMTLTFSKWLHSALVRPFG